MNPGDGGRPRLPLPRRLPRPRSLCPSSVRRRFAAPPSRRISSPPWAPGARRLANGEASPSAPRSPGGEPRRPGYAGGGTYPATGDNEWGSGGRGAGREEPEPGFVLRSVLYIFRRRRRRERWPGGGPPPGEGRPGWAAAEPLGAGVGAGRPVGLGLGMGCLHTQRDCEAPHRGVLKCFCRCVCREYRSVSGYAGACACFYPSGVLPGAGPVRVRRSCVPP